MPRERIAMSGEEVAAFLRYQLTAVLATHGPGGFPHQSAMWFVPDEDGGVRMWTYRASQKAVNLRRDPRASLLVESGEDYRALRGVLLVGEVRVVDDLERTLDVGLRLRQRYGERYGLETVEVLAAQAKKRVVLELRPAHVASWDHGRQQARS